MDGASEMPDSILSSSIMDPSPSVMATPIKSEPTPTALPVPSIVSTTPTTTPTTTPKIESITKKDSKEPMQIIRGGRVITLPPIEAPATRSKRLQAKVGNQQFKTEKKQHKIQHQQQQQQQQQLKVEPLIIKTERMSYVI